METVNKAWVAIETETLFLKLAEASSTAVWIVQDGRIRYANPAARSLTGYSREQLEKMPFDLLVLPGDRAATADALSAGEHKSLKVTLDVPAGEKEITLNASQVQMDGQTAVLLTGLESSSSPRLSAPAERIAAEMKAIFHTVAEAIVVFNPEGKVLQANASAERIYGMLAEGMHLKDLQKQVILRDASGRTVPPEEWPSQRTLLGETVFGQPFTITNSLGERYYLLVSSMPLFIEDQFAGAVVSYRDISEREKLMAQLRSERARLDAIIRHAPEAILVTDSRGHIVLANHNAERMFNTPLAADKSLIQLGFRAETPEGQPVQDEMLPMIRASRYGETINDHEISLVMPDGTRRELLLNSAPILEGDGTISGAITIALDISARKLSEQQARRNAARSELLSNLSKAFAEAGLYHAAVLTSISIQISENLGDTAIIRMLSDDRRWLDVVSVHHPYPSGLSRLRKIINAHRIRLDNSLEGESFRGKKTILISDISRFENRSILEKQYGSWLWENQTRSMLVVPLQAQDNVFGTLTMIRSEGEPYAEDDQFFFTNLAERAALAIENSRLFAEEQQRAREMDALHTATSALLNTLDLDELLQQILDSAQNAIPAADHSALHLIDDDTGRLEIRATRNFSEAWAARLASPEGADYPEFVCKNREPLLINDTLTRPETPLRAGELPKGGVRSLIIAPLIIRDEVLGTLSLTAARAHAFTREDLQLLISFATTTSAAIHNARLHAQVQNLALTDPLTELFNRRGFFELAQREMDRFLRYQYPLTAIMIDIDHFKNINDTLGHHTGDHVLRALAARLHQNIRQVDILGRYGGEEFILLLPDTELNMACETAERIRAAVQSQPILENEQGPVNLTISLGVSSARADTRTLAELLEQADQALYKAKQNGRNRLEIY